MEKQQEENVNTTDNPTNAATVKPAEQPKSSGGWGFSGWGFSNIIESVSSQVQQMNIMETVQQINTGLVETIKTTSDQMVTLYREDLKEFSTSIMNDTSQILQSQYDTVKQYIPDSISNAMEDLKNGTAASNNDNNNNNNQPSGSTGTPIKSPTNYLAKSLSFFTSDSNDIQEFEHWCESFDVDSHYVEIKTLLSSDDIRSLYSSYVPSKISHQQFWLKYFYKQYKTQKEEEKRQLILQQVTQEKEEEVGWDDFDEEETELSKLDINDNNNDNNDNNNNNNNKDNIQDLNQLENTDFNSLKQVQVLENIQPITPQKPEEKNEEEEELDSDEEIDREIERQRLLQLEKQKKLNETPKKPQEFTLVDDTFEDEEDDENIEINKNYPELDQISITPSKSNNNNNNNNTSLLNTPNKNININNLINDEEDFGWDEE
ncbi:hypothetical protein DICPUDRAFT_159669 [Dictyostelium purpureum]|uniref:BSD domain-containing protein n=1 Tax=Dictyostelium purpureum TaxID=5786 RepID=F1A4P4_DICPU|nr:uncharacterized protein DICPUDRAFT_159669 [Dictyostelium purpureum]EGC28834.1 hypothetical protein DICPUDRAFT_159669 [Dictyostelium purpureum]|eukprot:XP_003294634.1 hypothetical protein DICPUDRAFT_159669 [Dictyostelium purpureum]